MKRRIFTIERRFQCAPARLFAALTEPASLERWIWGAAAKDVSVSLDPGAGGELVASCRAWEESEFGERWSMRGHVTRCEPPERFEYLLRWEAPVVYNQGGARPLDEHVSFRLEADGEGTRMTYVHVGVPDDGLSAASHETAIRSTFDDLARLVEGEAP